MRRALLLSVFAAAACGGSLDSLYLSRGYDVLAPQAVKRIVVGGWAPSDHADVAALAARIGADYVKLRKNYLVHEPVVLTRSFAEGCGELEGVLALRTLDLDVDLEEEEITTRIAAELYRCKDGELLWRAEGELTADSDDTDLQNLAAAYEASVGAAARRYAAPVFVLVQELLSELPDPVLTDDEVLEKIELGAHETAPRSLAAR